MIHTVMSFVRRRRFELNRVAVVRIRVGVVLLMCDGV